jgi:hypothetical protein
VGLSEAIVRWVLVLPLRQRQVSDLGEARCAGPPALLLLLGNGATLGGLYLLSRQTVRGVIRTEGNLLHPHLDLRSLFAVRVEKTGPRSVLLGRLFLLRLRRKFERSGSAQVLMGYQRAGTNFF